MLDFAADVREICPDAWFLNYTNPMAVLTNVMNVYGGVRTVGLCHSMQACIPELFKSLGLEQEGVKAENSMHQSYGVYEQLYQAGSSGVHV